MSSVGNPFLKVVVIYEASYTFKAVSVSARLLVVNETWYLNDGRYGGQ